MKRFKELVRETAVEPDMPSSAARTYKEKPNKEPMAKLKEEEQKHPFVAVHAKKGMHQTHGSTSYEAAQNAAKHWKMKNTAGIDVYRADKKHIPEEVEQLDELSNELLARYKDKAVVSHGEAEKAKNYKLSDKRFSGVVKATNKQFDNMRKKPFNVKEETEQLDELSKSTLGSYVKKAAFSLGQKGIEVGQSDDKKKWSPITKKMNKRTDSIIKATDRLTKEETEQLDEISAETKASYTQKATKDIEQLKPHAEKGEYKDIAKNIIKKREKGIAMAKEDKDVPFEGGTTKPKQKVVSGKHGAGYSTARHLARQAMKKQIEKMKPVKESLEESRKAEIVKEIVKKKKNDKGSAETFQKEPVLSSEITKA